MKLRELFNPAFVFSHVMLAALYVAIFLPGAAKVKSPVAFCVAIAVIEVLFLCTQVANWRKGALNRHAGEVFAF